MQKRKATIIGAGHVGSHVALALVYEGVADEIVLVDKVEGAAAYLDDFRQVHLVAVCCGCTHAAPGGLQAAAEEDDIAARVLGEEGAHLAVDHAGIWLSSARA